MGIEAPLMGQAGPEAGAERGSPEGFRFQKAGLETDGGRMRRPNRS